MNFVITVDLRLPLDPPPIQSHSVIVQRISFMNCLIKLTRQSESVKGAVGGSIARWFSEDTLTTAVPSGLSFCLLLLRFRHLALQIGLILIVQALGERRLLEKSPNQLRRKFVAQVFNASVTY